ncbi:MAG: hypothetical protein JXA99_09200 [Candidatus Lokiarchaeota archaeon]|nr:hypothetical protein [Candidatus Lokiarchaeota archaeon]
MIGLEPMPSRISISTISYKNDCRRSFPIRRQLLDLNAPSMIRTYATLGNNQEHYHYAIGA